MPSQRGPHDRPQEQSYMRLLRERFPHVADLSLHLLEQNEDFRELCVEYEACARAAERLEDTAANEAMRKEYCALRLRIEAELLRYIAERGRV